MTERNQLTALVHVPEGTVVTNRDYATACWWAKLELQPGTYEMRADSRHGLTYMNWCSIPGTILDCSFASGFGGMYYPNRENDKRKIGRTEHYSVFRYAHNLEDQVMENGIKIEVIKEVK